MSTVVTVLRSGGDFAPWHVQAMQRQVRRWSPPGTEFYCLSDQQVEGVDCIPLQYDWPGWWAKMELFDRSLGLDDFLYTDLDNVIMGDLGDMLKVKGFVCQRGGWTALMHVPRNFDNGVMFDVFASDPQYFMGIYGNQSRSPYGDAGYIANEVFAPKYWEDLLPGQATNIVDALTPLGPRPALVTPTTRVLLFGGRKRRPWLLPGFRQLYGEDL